MANDIPDGILPTVSPSSFSPAAHRIVIDTNVCLDLFLFRDARWDGLLSALADGRIQAVTRTDCRNEWLLVLDYPRLRIAPERRPEVAARFDAAITCLDHDACPPQPELLPLCKDRDDQKFMEVARDAGAAVLLTRDKALLKLGKRTVKRGLFRIAHPEIWIKEVGLVSAGDQPSAGDVPTACAPSDRTHHPDAPGWSGRPDASRMQPASDGAYRRPFPAASHHDAALQAGTLQTDPSASLAPGKP